MDGKVCSSTNCLHGDAEQPLTSFFEHSRMANGEVRYQSWCKDCMRETQRLRATERRRRLGLPERNGMGYKIKDGHKRDHPRNDPKLPWAPIGRQIELRGLTGKEVQAQTGVSERWLSAAKRDGQLTMDMADRLATGLDLHLSLLYPDQYQ